MRLLAWCAAQCPFREDPGHTREVGHRSAAARREPLRRQDPAGWLKSPQGLP